MTNVGFRLRAAGQIIELRQAENDPIGTFRIIGLNVRFRITKPVVLCGAVATLSSLTHTSRHYQPLFDNAFLNHSQYQKRKCLQWIDLLFARNRRKAGSLWRSLSETSDRPYTYMLGAALWRCLNEVN